MAPLSAILLIFSYIMAVITAPIVAPPSETSIGPVSDALETQTSSDDTLSVAATGPMFISGATLPPVDMSIFKRFFVGLNPAFSRGGGGGRFGHGGPKGGGGLGGCGVFCFLEKPDKPGKSKHEDDDASAVPPDDSQDASPAPQALTPTSNNPPAQANASKSQNGNVKGGKTRAGGRKGSPKASGGN